MKITESLDKTLIEMESGIEAESFTGLINIITNLRWYWYDEGRKSGFDEGYMSRMEEEEEDDTKGRL